MRTIALSVLICFISFTSVAQERMVKGQITDGSNPLENVNIIIKSTDQGVQTDKQGYYQIKANVGETLVYSSVGKRNIEILIEDVTTRLNIEMEDVVVELDEVVISKPKTQEEKEIEYLTNKDLIRTYFGTLDKNKLGYSMAVVDEEDIDLRAGDFTEILPLYFPGIRVIKNKSETIVYTPRNARARGIPAIFEVDGLLFAKVPTFVQVTDIKRMAMIEAFGGLNRYGHAGRGGIIIINTKSGNQYSGSDDGSIDLARRTDNIVNENNAVEFSENASNYLTKLYSAKSIKEVEEICLKYSNIVSASFYNILDTYGYLLDKFPNEEFTTGFLQKHKKSLSNNPLALKVLAYMYDEKGTFKESNDVYTEIFRLRPNYAQSYLDLARSFENIGNTKRAAELLVRYKDLVQRKGYFDESKNLDPIVTKDLMQVLTIGNWDKKGKRKKEFKEVEEGTRLVFEWDNSEAEFELSFVTPNKHVEIWEHSMANDSERINEEKQLGYSMQEFMLDRAIPGNWDVNIKYLGNKSLTPTYLKTTVYHNWGKPNQHKEIKLFKLHLKDVNMRLFSIAVTLPNGVAQKK